MSNDYETFILTVAEGATIDEVRQIAGAQLDDIVRAYPGELPNDSVRSLRSVFIEGFVGGAVWASEDAARRGRALLLAASEVEGSA